MVEHSLAILAIAIVAPLYFRRTVLAMCTIRVDPTSNVEIEAEMLRGSMALEMDFEHDTRCRMEKVMLVDPADAAATLRLLRHGVMPRYDAFSNEKMPEGFNGIPLKLTESVEIHA